MREIKFRAWDEERKRMLYFEPLKVTWFYEDDYRIDAYEAEGTVIGRGGMVHDDYSASSPQSIIMQYTGLKDKNGKEIYEGDIILFSNNRRHIKFDRGSFTMYYGDCRMSPLSDYVVENRVEVIGNIYENPELLEVA